MKASEMREKDVKELQEEIYRIGKERFSLLMQKSAGELQKSDLLKKSKRDIARLKTIISEKSR
jgi:large subunit ribosomal protein L29